MHGSYPGFEATVRQQTSSRLSRERCGGLCCTGISLTIALDHCPSSILSRPCPQRLRVNPDHVGAVATPGIDEPERRGVDPGCSVTTERAVTAEADRAVRERPAGNTAELIGSALLGRRVCVSLGHDEIQRVEADITADSTRKRREGFTGVDVTRAMNRLLAVLFVCAACHTPTTPPAPRPPALRETSRSRS